MTIYKAGENKSLPDWCGLTGWDMSHHTPGTLIESHFHDHDELVIIVLGRMLVRTGNTETILLPGDSVLTRAGDTHEWLALDESTAVHLAMRLQGQKRPGPLH